MASVFKATYRRKDPKSGKVVVRKYRKWSIKYKDESGRWKIVPGLRDKEATLALARQLEKRAEQIRAGIHDPFEEHRKTELARHVDAFRVHLESKGNTQDHVDKTVARVNEVVNACCFDKFDHISASSVSEHLAELRKSKKLTKRTSNYYLGAFKSFCNWMVKDRRAAFNPVVHLTALNTEGENSRPRRVISAKQFSDVIEAARKYKGRVLPPGPDRAALYMVAAFTGFRAKELRNLRPIDFDMDAGSVTCRAGYSKRRRQDTQPLRADLVDFLKGYLKGRKPTEAIWGGMWYRKAATMLQHDLEAAEVPYKDERGEFFDFHAIRHSYITHLHRGGTYGKVLQSLARHSTPTLTARYTHVDVSDVQAALEGLPAIAPATEPEQRKKNA